MFKFALGYMHPLGSSLYVLVTGLLFRSSKEVFPPELYIWLIVESIRMNL